MTSMPRARLDAPLPLVNCLAELMRESAAMARADGCPECDNVEPPKSWGATDEGCRTAHLCADCGAAWTTDWKDDA
jgi:hypothetical protein